MCAPVIHLQNIAHFGTQNVVPACWKPKFVIDEDGLSEVFGEGWRGDLEIYVTPNPSIVTCAACRKLIH